MTESRTTLRPDVPVEVFDKFLNALQEANLPEEVVYRLRVVLLEERNFTDRALKAAVLGEEALP